MVRPMGVVMKLNRITEKAKEAIDRRGGVDGLGANVHELRTAVGRPGSLREKARAAADALKQPARSGPRATPHDRSGGDHPPAA